VLFEQGGTLIGRIALKEQFQFVGGGTSR